MIHLRIVYWNINDFDYLILFHYCLLLSELLLNITLPTSLLPAENVIALEQKINYRSYPRTIILSHPVLSPSFSLGRSFSRPLALCVIKSQNGCISFTNICRLRLPKRVEERCSRGRRGQRHGKVQYWIPTRPAGSPSSWQIYVARIREVRVVYINLITRNDVTSERPRPLARPAPSTHQYCKTLASTPSSTCHSRTPKMPLVKLILRYMTVRRRRKKNGSLIAVRCV